MCSSIKREQGQNLSSAMVICTAAVNREEHLRHLLLGVVLVEDVEG